MTGLEAQLGRRRSGLTKIWRNKKTKATDGISLPSHVAMLGGLCLAMVLNGTAMAQSVEKTTGALEPHTKSKTVVHHKKIAHAKSGKPAIPSKTDVKITAVSGLSPEDQAIAAARAASPARFDKVYGLKGWDIHFPSYGDTLLQDYGGWRSTLAKYGFGFMLYDAAVGAVNINRGPTYGVGASKGPGHPPENQQYWGQRPDLLNIPIALLFYDTSQWGVPDGQLEISGQQSWSSLQHHVANKLSLNGLWWYQTLFNKAVEIKVGIVPTGLEFVGAYIGGNLASPFGPNASIQYEMGMDTTPSVQPAARATWHITDTVYNETGIIRSTPINGPTGDVFYDDAHANPTGFSFTVPNGRALFVDEFGWKNEASPAAPATWARFGAMYNTSKYGNYQTGGTTTGVGAMYFLVDRQLWQSQPNSPFTAYKGIYAGVSTMYTPPANNAVSQYYEARLYYIGLFDSRPTDQFAVVYSHNVYSRYLTALINQGGYDFNTGMFAHNASNTITASYTAHLMPGVYGTLGLGYTDNPSIPYTRIEGHAFQFIASTFIIF